MKDLKVKIISNYLFASDIFYPVNLDKNHGIFLRFILILKSPTLFFKNKSEPKFQTWNWSDRECAGKEWTFFTLQNRLQKIFWRCSLCFSPFLFLFSLVLNLGAHFIGINYVKFVKIITIKIDKNDL